jgi:hypothetical protein
MASGIIGQLAPESRFDEAEVRVVSPAIGAEDLLVPLGDDRESPALRSVDRALEIHSAPGVQDEPTAGDGVAVDRDVGDGAERSVVPEAQDIDLSRSRKHMS